MDFRGGHEKKDRICIPSDGKSYFTFRKIMTANSRFYIKTRISLSSFVKQHYSNRQKRKSRFFVGRKIHDTFDVRVSRVLNLFSIGFVILLDEVLNFSTRRRTSRSSPWPQSCVPKTSWSAGKFFG